MKKGITLLTAGIILATSMTFGTSVSANESQSENAFGGWSESEGYYSNMMLRAVIKPDTHVGKRLSKTVGSQGDQVFASQGVTTWKGTLHYTTAQIQNSGGTVRTNSGRVWRKDYTVATSPYYTPRLFENIEARTYWGY